MAQSTVALISKHAKRTRKKGEAWPDAIARSSRELKGTKKAPVASSRSSRKRKSVPSKKAAYKPRKKVHQTGSSSRLHDEKVKAKAPGRRTVKTSKGKSHNYYENRKNRSDMPGKMTGTKSAYNEMIIRRMAENNTAIGAAEASATSLQASIKTAAKDPGRKKMLQQSLERVKKYISTLKADQRMLKRLIA